MIDPWIYAIGAVIVGLLAGVVGAALVYRIIVDGRRERQEARDAARATSTFLFLFFAALGVIVAVGFLNPETLEPIPADVLRRSPLVLAAGLILIAARATAFAVTGMINAAFASSTGRIRVQMAVIARAVVYVVGVVLALSQLGVETTVLTMIVGAVAFGGAAAFALLVGLGGGDGWRTGRRPKSSAARANRRSDHGRWLVRPGGRTAPDEHRVDPSRWRLAAPREHSTEPWGSDRASPLHESRRQVTLIGPAFDDDAAESGVGACPGLQIEIGHEHDVVNTQYVVLVADVEWPVDRCFIDHRLLVGHRDTEVRRAEKGLEVHLDPTAMAHGAADGENFGCAWGVARRVEFVASPIELHEPDRWCQGRGDVRA